MDRVYSSSEKALKVNLDPSIYGTFAEIGAGQEVVNYFFKAGAASGTVAKSISAYDMTFSDSIYGKEESGRYVCRSRLEKMLSYEYDLVVQRLTPVREKSRFFAFSNTVSARNFHGTNEQHGWLGLRFQVSPGSVFSQIIVHTRMHDKTNLHQQTALGKLGVNLIYSSYFNTNLNEGEFVESLMENLSKEQLEIDMISCEGPAFKDLDERLMALELVKKEFTDAIVFTPDAKVSLASDELYKKNIQIIRGSYRPPTKVNLDVIKCGKIAFEKETKGDVVCLSEITISNLLNEGGISNEDFLARVDLLCSLDQPVMISSFMQYYKLTNFLSRFKPKKVSLVLGTYNFMQIFDSDYNILSGRTLEAIGTLLAKDTQVYLYPYKEDDEDDVITTLENVKVSQKNKPLLDYIKSSGQVKKLEGVDTSLLHIYSRKVLDMIVNETDGWEDFVPDIVAKTIREKCLFGHVCL